jgi:Flp pilus assembly protein TadD
MIKPASQRPFDSPPLFMRSGAFSFFILLALSGCATAPKQTAPSFSPPVVTRTWQAVAKARDTIRDLEATAPASVRPGIASLKEDLANAQHELGIYTSAVGTQTDALNKAESDKNAALLQNAYIEGKRQKALREVWIWRLVILTEIGCVAGWIAFRGGVKAFLA